MGRPPTRLDTGAPLPPVPPRPWLRSPTGSRRARPDPPASNAHHRGSRPGVTNAPAPSGNARTAGPTVPASGPPVRPFTGLGWSPPGLLSRPASPIRGGRRRTPSGPGGSQRVSQTVCWSRFGPILRSPLSHTETGGFLAGLVRNCLVTHETPRTVILSGSEGSQRDPKHRRYRSRWHAPRIEILRRRPRCGLRSG